MSGQGADTTRGPADDTTAGPADGTTAGPAGGPAGRTSDGAAYDVAVIGAGIVGSAIPRALCGFRLSVALIEAQNDVGDGTSKANTAILHTGFDATPGTLDSRLVRRGWSLLDTYATVVGIPVERTGALLVAWTPDEVAPGLLRPDVPRPASRTAAAVDGAAGADSRVTATQDGRRLGNRRLPWPASPGRARRLLGHHRRLRPALRTDHHRHLLRL